MPRLSPVELQAARVRSGRLGGRPRKPTVEEARAAALEALVPKAVQVLRAHLGQGDEVNPAAWRAALRVFEHAYGRAPEAVDEPMAFPDSDEALATLSWEHMKAIAATSRSPRTRMGVQA
jgi:hypothetical protein